MTGALSYISYDEFDAESKEVLDEDLAAFAKDFNWWLEAPQFVETEGKEEFVTGSNRLLRRTIKDDSGQIRKVDYRDDVILGMVDYLETIEILTALSKEHAFIWTIGYPAEPKDKVIGEIVDGEIDPEIFEFLIHEMEALEISEDDLQDKALHEQIRSKYFDASCKPIFS